MTDARPPTLPYETPPHKGRPAPDGGPLMLFGALTGLMGVLVALMGLSAQHPLYVLAGTGIAVVGVISVVLAIILLRRRDAR